MQCLVIFLSVVAVHAALNGTDSNPITPSNHIPISYETHPHLSSSYKVKVDDTHVQLNYVEQDADTAVIFHGMPGAGKHLLVSKLHETDRSISYSDYDFTVYDLIKYNHGTRTLHAINVNNIEHGDPDSEIDGNIAAALSFIDDQGLTLTSVYVIIDVNAVNEEYVNKVCHYVTDIKRQYGKYGPLTDDRIKLIFNKVDLIDDAQLIQVAALFKEKLSSIITVNDVIATSAFKGVGCLIADLKKAIIAPPFLSHKTLNQIRLRKLLLNSQMEMEKIVLDCDQQKLKLVQKEAETVHSMAAMSKAISCTSSFIIRNNYMPDVSILKLPFSSPDPDTEILWTVNWMRTGAKRVPLASHFFDHGHYKDTKKGYDEFVSFCAQKQDQLYRHNERVESASSMEDNMAELYATRKQYQDRIQQEIRYYEHGTEISANVLQQTKRFCDES